MLLVNGTQHILNGDNNFARFNAKLAYYFEEWTAVYIGKTNAVVNWTKVMELCVADDHTLVQYYRKRIPCSCLDKKYKAVKSVKKMGVCCNPNCSVQKVERRKMFCCTGCGEINYCSIECQKADWKSHKEFCGSIAEDKAAFQSELS